MAKRDNHYERAFEDYLRAGGVPYIAVDEQRRSVLSEQLQLEREAGESLKNVDFIVWSRTGWTWLVDVKGRRFPAGGRQYWKNWSTRDDLDSLSQWQNLLGERFQGMFVFAYNVVGNRAPLPAEQMFEYRGGLYGFLGVRAEHYAWHCRPLSARWQTVAMPVARFRELAQPFAELL